MIQYDDSGDGSFTAKIASLGVVDLDFDVTLPGAFKNGQRILVSQWGHSAILGSAQPAGLGTIRADNQNAYVDGVWFSTDAGQQTRKLVKEAGPLTEWSHGYKVLAASTDYKELRQYGPAARQLLKSLDVYEASPVLKGAGIGTQTVNAKHGKYQFGDWEMSQILKQSRDALANARAIMERSRPFDPEQEELNRIWLANIARQFS